MLVASHLVILIILYFLFSQNYYKVLGLFSQTGQFTDLPEICRAALRVVWIKLGTVVEKMSNSTVGTNEDQHLMPYEYVDEILLELYHLFNLYSGMFLKFIDSCRITR